MGKIKGVRKYFKYYKKELGKVYEKIVSESWSSFNKGNLSRCLRCIDAAALLQYNVNERYADKRLNELLSRIADNNFDDIEIKGDRETVCLIDSFSRDNRGLIQQYLDAVIWQNKYRIVYITESDSIGNDIQKMLKEANAMVVKVNCSDIVHRAKTIYDVVVKKAPFMILFHLSPNSMASIIALKNIKGIMKVQINLTDHAFWLGDSNFFDTSIEFRAYGKAVSLEKRGFLPEQTVIMPYYPWDSRTPFKGFPVNVSGRVVMFSGGALYKTEGGGDKYFTILKSILDKYPQVVFFYAGNGNRTHFEAFINENGYENRIYLIGLRSDITEVFRNSDIYYSTYPLFGGLMSQYAAINGIPILAYESKEIESVVCTKQRGNFTFESESDLVHEAGLLIENPEYRRGRGAFFKNLCIGQEDFRERMKAWMEIGEKPVERIEKCVIDYEKFCEQYIQRINTGSQELGIELMLLRRCPRAMSWKMWLNVLLNMREVIKIQKRRKTTN